MLNNIMGRNKQNHNDSSVIINGNEVTDYQVIANKFNEYFSTVAEKLIEKIPHTNQNPLKYLKNQPKSSLFLSATSPWEIKKILNEIPSKYNSGWDDIPSVVVKKSPDNILVALSHIFNLSLNTGIFPNLFKKAKIIPIPKVRNPKTLNQYRPISLLPIFSKILEKIVHKRFYSFLSLNSLLSPTQFGFRKL